MNKINYRFCSYCSVLRKIRKTHELQVKDVAGYQVKHPNYRVTIRIRDELQELSWKL